MTKAYLTYLRHIYFCSRMLYWEETAMRVWVYGGSLAQIQTIADRYARSGDAVIGVSLCAGDGAQFPQSGLTRALCSAMRGEIDLIVVSDHRLLGNNTQIKEMEDLFCRYGAAIKSASSCGISSS